MESGMTFAKFEERSMESGKTSMKFGERSVRIWGQAICAKTMHLYYRWLRRRRFKLARRAPNLIINNQLLIVNY
jgi:hypothetical protein